MALTLDGTNGIVSSGSITTQSATGIVFSDSSSLPAASSPYVLKNRIINGAMVIDQRNAGASVTPSSIVAGIYGLDRWATYGTQASKFSVQQNAGAVTPPVGFTNYVGITVGASANVTVGTSDLFQLYQIIEGYNVADLAWGTASAQPVTISFWVRSSLTGTFSGSIYLAGAYPFQYTISSANTWEYKTVTISANTGNSVNSTTVNAGFVFTFDLGAGSDYSATAGSWGAGAKTKATGSVNLVSTNSATLYITGVQLEVGSTATPFERRLYNAELANCQRYFETSYNQGSSPQAIPTNAPNSYAFLASGTNTIGGGVNAAQQIMGPFFFKVQKRALSTVTIYSYATSTTSMVGNGWTGTNLAADSGAIGDTYTYGFTVINKSGGNVTTGGYGILFGYSASAEL
jgi:hypothetical protein